MIFFPLTFAGLAVGHYFPMFELNKSLWIYTDPNLLFCGRRFARRFTFTAKRFLSAGFLYAILGLGILGMLFANESIQMPAFVGWESEKLGMLVPFLFITVACGACSGFHSIVSSGTTSKQIKRESDVRRISYGGMLVEGVLAVFAMGVRSRSYSERKGSGRYTGRNFRGRCIEVFGAVGIPVSLGAEFAMLAISTFLLTTLDTCTRLTRFLIEELLNWKSEMSRYLGTGLALALPAFLVFKQFPGVDGNLQPAWKAIWPFLEQLINCLPL